MKLFEEFKLYETMWNDPEEEELVFTAADLDMSEEEFAEFQKPKPIPKFKFPEDNSETVIVSYKDKTFTITSEADARAFVEEIYPAYEGYYEQDKSINDLKRTAAYRLYIHAADSGDGDPKRRKAASDALVKRLHNVLREYRALCDKK
jgi:hypothetical protein